MNIEHWHWQQWSVAIMVFINLLANGLFHGETRERKYNIGYGIVNVSLAAWIYISSGFWA